MKFITFRVHVRTSNGKQGWLPMSILMQTALSEESSSMNRPEDSHYRREYVFVDLIHNFSFIFNIFLNCDFFIFISLSFSFKYFYL